MKANIVHVWQDSRNKKCVQIFWWRGILVFLGGGKETANRKGRMQARVWRGRHLSKLLNSWRKAQFGLAVIQAAMWRVAVKENWAMWSAVLTQSDVHWLGTSVPVLKPLGHFYNWGEAMPQRVKSVHPAQHNRSVVLAAHISTRLQKGCNVYRKKYLRTAWTQAWEKSAELKRQDMDWTG